MADMGTEHPIRRIAALETAVLEVMGIRSGGSGRPISSLKAEEMARDIISARDDSGEDPAHPASPEAPDW